MKSFYAFVQSVSDAYFNGYTLREIANGLPIQYDTQSSFEGGIDSVYFIVPRNNSLFSLAGNEDGEFRNYDDDYDTDNEAISKARGFSESLIVDVYADNILLLKAVMVFMKKEQKLLFYISMACRPEVALDIAEKEFRLSEYEGIELKEAIVERLFSDYMRYFYVGNWEDYPNDVFEYIEQNRYDEDSDDTLMPMPERNVYHDRSILQRQNNIGVNQGYQQGVYPNQQTVVQRNPNTVQSQMNIGHSVDGRNIPHGGVKDKAIGGAAVAVGAGAVATGAAVGVAGGATQVAGGATQVAGGATRVAGTGMKVVGTGAKVTGRVMNIAGKGMQLAGAGIRTASAALGAIPIVGGVFAAAGAVTGGAVDVAGKATDLGGSVVHAGGSVTHTAGKVTDKIGKAEGEIGKDISEKGKDISEKGVDIREEGVAKVKDGVNRTQGVETHQADSIKEGHKEEALEAKERAEKKKQSLFMSGMSVQDEINASIFSHKHR